MRTAVADSAEFLARLRRYPDVEAPGLVAVDGADRLLLDGAADRLRDAGDGAVAVIDDAYGALTLGAAHFHDLRDVRVHQDLLIDERALAHNGEEMGLADRYRHCSLGPDLLSGAQVVLLRLPHTLPALAEMAYAVGRFAAPDVVLYAGGRDKHLSYAMNSTLAEYFSSVTASLGRQKSRLLIAEGPRTPEAQQFPVHADIAEFGGIHVVAHGAVFAGARLHAGTRFLLEHVPAMTSPAHDAVDLGCGTGILAVALAKARPELIVTATDQSASAVASAQATAAANGVGDRVAVLRDDVMVTMSDASVDLIVCHPPFGTAGQAGVAPRMFRAAGRVLRSGGELWTVFDAHLHYLRVLERLVGPTEVIGRNPRFAVTRSRRR